MLSRYTLFGGRRAWTRRQGTDVGAYVDRYSSVVASMIVAIALLSALDAAFTLLYLQRGGEEANPLMAAVIAWGPLPFVLIKCGITSIGLAVLCLHKNFRFVKPVIVAILGVYTALLAYHLYLVSLMA